MPWNSRDKDNATLPEQRFESPCPNCTYVGQVEAEGVSVDVFACLEDGDGQQDPYSVLLICWGPDNNYDQHDNWCLATGTASADGTHRHLCVGELDGVPLRALWAKALHLVVQDARKYRIAREFHRLATAWSRDTRHLSSLHAIVDHPAYRSIVALGWPVVPILLDALEDAPDWWFSALEEITGTELVVPDEAVGRVGKLAEIWLAFAKKKGWRA